MKHRTSYNICIIISLLLGFMSLGACSTPTAYDQVVESYAHDSLKREAAVYLATYSKFHYGVARNIVDASGQFSNLSPMMFASDSVYRAYMDSLHYYLKKGKPVLDEDTITEAYLKKNIDLAFDSWRKPWAKGVSFADFCRYILPYRNGDEELTEWRDYLKQKYEHLITDSMMENANTKDLAEGAMSFYNELIYQKKIDNFFNESNKQSQLQEKLMGEMEKINQLSLLFVKETKITFYGLDFLYDSEKNMFYILEINYFPSYRELGAKLHVKFDEHIVKYHSKYKN